MASHYYIYYRVRPDAVAACEAKVRQLVASVAQTTGVSGRVLKKRGEPNLWMEVYEGVADEAKFEWELAEALARLEFQDLLQANSTRHIECFHD